MVSILSLLFWFVALALSTTLLIILRWLVHVRTSRFHKVVNRIPGPSPVLPLVGNALSIRGGFDHVLRTIHAKWPQTYGELYRFSLGSHYYVVFSSPELMEPVLNSQKTIDKGVDYELMIPWLGYGLLTSTGAKWKSRRRLLTPAFHYKILDNFFSSFNEQSRILCRIIAERCEKQGNKEMDVFPLMTLCSLDIICEAAMGCQLNAQTKKDSDYVYATYRIGHIFIERFKKPWLLNETVFALTSLGREHERVLKVVHNFADKIINERREQFKKESRSTDPESAEKRETGIKNRLALLDLLLEASDDGKVLNHLDIREEIDTFMFAGHDTTTSSMCWFLHCMASHPDYQEKVCDELRDVFGESDRDCSPEDLTNLKYLECCIKESLRLYPAVPAYERATHEDIIIGGYVIPAGSNLIMSAFATHRNPRLYPNPLVYDPERFSLEQSVGRHPYAYIPFSAGPRNCIGQRFAMMEMKVVLSTLLRHFAFNLSPLSKTPVPSIQLVLKSITGINLLVSRRSSSNQAGKN